MKIAKFLAATAIGGLATAVPAFGQENVEDGFSDDADSGIIIVTATKRERTLQEIPVAVTVTSAADIEKAQIRDLSDLQTLAPTLRVNQLQSSANTNFIIRGFGNGANNAGLEPSVGVFIDGVYRSRSAARIGDLPTLQRIEVLRGPQSTLFGKNASAGIISIVTQKPQYQFGGAIEASYGNYNAKVAKAYITGPISDNIAFSIGGNYNKRDGYAQDLNLETDVNDRNRYGIRGQLLVEPGDDLTIRLIGDYDHSDENCCVAVNLINGPTGAIVDDLAGGVGLDAENPFSYNVYTNQLSENLIKNWGGSGQIDYQLGAVNLTSITAYRGVDSYTNQDSDFTAAKLIGKNTSDTKIRTFTQELRVASDFDGPVNFLLGGFYFNENIDVVNDIEYGDDFRKYADTLIKESAGEIGGVSTLEIFFGSLDSSAGLAENAQVYDGRFFASGTGYHEAYTLDDEAYSLFATVDFEPFDGLVVTGGINYTDDRKQFSNEITSSDVFSTIDFNASQYEALRKFLLQLSGVPAEQAAFLAANPTLPDANPLAALRPFQYLPPAVNLPNEVEDGRTNDNKFTYTARLAYEVAPSLNIYASYATGFKASSINLSRDSRPLASDAEALAAAGLLQSNQSYGTRLAGPENATVYEAGIKGNWDVAAFNLAVFRQSIRGFQSNVFVGTGFELANAGEQTTDGIEFDGSVSPAAGLKFNVAMVYLDPEYTSFPNSIYGDISGTTPSTIPALSMTLGVDYEFDISDSLSLNLRADYHYESKVNLFDDNPSDPTSTNFTREIDALNMSTTLAYNDMMKFTVWARNLTNATYLTAAFLSVGQPGSFTGYPNQPRTFGVTAKYQF